MTKICSQCKQELPMCDKHFTRNKSHRGGFASQCKSCRSDWAKTNRGKINKQKREYGRKNPDRVMEWNLKSKFGITLSEYNNTLEDQKGRCAICNRIPTSKKLAVDHCHSTNNIRGLLCSNCNTALGSFKDNIQFLKSAIKYLEKHNQDRA